MEAEEKTENNLMLLIENIIRDTDHMQKRFTSVGEAMRVRKMAAMAQGVLLGFALAEKDSDECASANSGRTVRDEAGEIIALALKLPEFDLSDLEVDSEVVH